MTRTLSDELAELHADYVTAVNLAVEADEDTAAESLATAYDEDAWRVVAEWEGKTHLLGALRPAHDTPLRRVARRLRRPHAA